MDSKTKQYEIFPPVTVTFVTFVFTFTLTIALIVSLKLEFGRIHERIYGRITDGSRMVYLRTGNMPSSLPDGEQ